MNKRMKYIPDLEPTKIGPKLYDPETGEQRDTEPQSELDLGARCRAVTAILKERERQDELKAAGKFLWSCADKYSTVTHHDLHMPITRPIESSEKLTVLAEEFGEVSRVVCEGLANKGLDETALKAELTQVAAVCLAWLEALD